MNEPTTEAGVALYLAAKEAAASASMDAALLRAAAADVLARLPVLLGTKDGDITAAFGAVGRLADLVEQTPRTDTDT